MKWKTVLSMLLAVILCVSSVVAVNAATVSDDGEYSLILTVQGFGETIDGEFAKMIRFHVQPGEKTVRISELAQGVIPFNGKTQFAEWLFMSGERISDEVPIEKFNNTGNFYTSSGKEVTYTNGLVLRAAFSDQPLSDSGNLYVSLNAFGGALNGQSMLLLQSKREEFKTVDLGKYLPTREGYTFCGWEYSQPNEKAKIVTSIDLSYFTKDAVVCLNAAYTKNTFSGEDRVVRLNANGGMTNGEAILRVDYFAGGDSGTKMSLLPYVPTREGYQFLGWNMREDGAGEWSTHLYWRLWDLDAETSLERNEIMENPYGAKYYKYVTLYAIWKRIEIPEVKLESTGEIKGCLELKADWDENYRLVITPVEVSKQLAEKNVKFAADIRVMRGEEEVEVNGVNVKIRMALPEDLKGYDHYKVVDINRQTGQIQETLSATLENGMISFENTSLSQYGIVATKDENTTGGETRSGTTAGADAKTGDNGRLSVWVTLLLLSGGAFACATVIGKKKNQKA